MYRHQMKYAVYRVARLLDLLRSLAHSFGLSIILVTHDIGIVRLLVHPLLVM